MIDYSQFAKCANPRQALIVCIQKLGIEYVADAAVSFTNDRKSTVNGHGAVWSGARNAWLNDDQTNDLVDIIVAQSNNSSGWDQS